jgi:uncharacterized UPF0160 family protein
LESPYLLLSHPTAALAYHNTIILITTLQLITIQAVPEDPNSFASRKKLPDVWCGLRDDILSEKTGVPGGIFIHASGFIGGHKTAEGALKMAIMALDM